MDNPIDEKHVKEFNEQTSKFLTPKVYNEAQTMETRVTMFQILLETHREEGETPKETFDRVGEEIKPKMKEKLHRYFNNMVEYYEKEFQSGKNIQQITDSITYDLSFFTNLNDRVYPTSQTLGSSPQKITEYEKIIDQNDLVDHEDVDIIVQMKIHQDSIGQDMELITRDSGFNSDEQAWEENFPKISVKDIS
ncbi:hypothetical protein [Candidatus Nanohalococcus occultus]|uniref:hypothetical protein n=1 Tax=Candidatus Nanohalococcus occultus TaxID=2978047 RepID=UPI0039DF31C5